MMQLKPEIHRRGGALVDHWRTFWFRVEPAYTLGIVRIAFGGLLVVWTLWMFKSLYAGFGIDGIVPRLPSRAGIWSVFYHFTSHEALLVGWCVLLAASIALMVGWHSRLAAILVFILIVSLERRNPAIFNGGDALLRIESIFMMLAPCGAALSLDQRRRTGSFWSAQEIRPWALRLIQIQLSIVYLSTVVAKLGGDTWQNGTAVLYSLSQEDLQNIPAPTWMMNSLFISNALTWGTLVIEVAIGVLVWNRRFRPWVLALGVALHLSISLTIQVGFFTWVTFILYLAFIPPERAEKIANGAQKRLSALTSRFRRPDVADDDEDVFDLAGRDAGEVGVNGKVHDEWLDEKELVAVRPRPPALSASEISAALDATKRSGSAPTPEVAARARRLADAPIGGPHLDAVRAPVPQREVDDEPAGRHSRHAMR